MSHFSEVDPGAGFPPFQAALEAFGFVPNLFRAQTLLPRALELQSGFLAAVLFTSGSLTRAQKERILLVLSASRQNSYCATLHAQTLLLLEADGAQVEELISSPRSARLPPKERELIEFARRLQGRPASIGPGDVQRLREAGCDDEAILEAVLTAGLASYLCALSVGLGVPPDLDPATVLGAWPPGIPPVAPEDTKTGIPPGATEVPYLGAKDPEPGTAAPLAFLEDRCGFVPNLLRAQRSRPAVLEAETRMFAEILLSEGVLPRRLKTSIALAVSAADRNIPCVTMHAEMLRRQGVPEESCRRIALDHREAGLPPAEMALLELSLRISQRPGDVHPQDVRSLLEAGFTEVQALEAVVTASFACFLDTVQAGLGTAPDFEPRIVLAPRTPPAGPVGVAAGRVDPDADEVRRAKQGDLEAFAVLVDRYAAPLFRLSQHVTGDAADAEACLQGACLKAFERLRESHGTPLFRTWLTRLALEEGLAKLLEKGRPARLDEPDEEDGTFKPKDVRAWVDDLEEAGSTQQRRRLVEQELSRLPLKFRLPLLLRDLDDLPLEDAADALGLPLPVLKARLSRGRLMLREALAPHFLRGEARRDAER
jgi:RNA polymerase sigma-70 factor, ECF subfamily